jgi:hypothetical protein
MMKYLLSLLILCAPTAWAQSAAAGSWHTEFDTQVGVQKYDFVLKQDGAALTATAKAVFQGQSRDVVFKDVQVKGDTITFTENFEFQGNSLPITYTGVIAGKEIKFVRKVGDVATEEFVAKKL